MEKDGASERMRNNRFLRGASNGLPLFYSILFYFILLFSIWWKNKRNDVIVNNIKVGEEEGKKDSISLKYMVTVDSPLLFIHTDYYDSDNLYTTSTNSTIFLTEYQICQWHTESSSKIEMKKSWMA